MEKYNKIIEFYVFDNKFLEEVIKCIIYMVILVYYDDIEIGVIDGVL